MKNGQNSLNEHSQKFVKISENWSNWTKNWSKNPSLSRYKRANLDLAIE
jgi:hypothetical protein